MNPVQQIVGNDSISNLADPLDSDSILSGNDCISGTHHILTKPGIEIPRISPVGTDVQNIYATDAWMQNFVVHRIDCIMFYRYVPVQFNAFV